MKFSAPLLLLLPSLALASPGEPLKRQAGTTVIAACATLPASDLTASATISPTLLAEAVIGCIGIEAEGTDDTANDIVDGVCKPVTLIFARGTGEDPNLGNIVGPPFIDALEVVFGIENLAVQGVNDYPADVAGFCAGGSSTGTADLAELIEQTLTDCPSTKLIVSGYSQGAQVVHNAAKLISSSATNFIKAVVLFGDPDDGQAVGSVPESKVLTDCHAGDNICAGGAEILEPHLSYCHDVGVYAVLAEELVNA